MRAELQEGTFSHGKCPQCKYLALLDKFEHKKQHMTNVEVSNKEPDAPTIEGYILHLTCPICGYGQCEALFPNEMN